MTGRIDSTGVPGLMTTPAFFMVDYVLVMTVNPGFGGQAFIDSTVTKLKQLSSVKSANNLTFDIEVDGGINDKTVDTVIENGATMLVAGSYFIINRIKIANRKFRFDIILI